MTSPISEPEQSLSIVVLGDFNPSIFQPLWFSSNGLMPIEETKAAEITVIHRKVAAFLMGGIQVQVDESRFGLTTTEDSCAPLLRDLAAGTLSILEHTPLKAIGLNLDRAIELSSEEEVTEFVDAIAPKQHWEDILHEPHAQQVIIAGTRTDCIADRIQIRVQRVAEHRVFVGINQHYQLATDGDSEPRECHHKALRSLREDWTGFCRFADEAATRVMRTNQAGERQ